MYEKSPNSSEAVAAYDNYSNRQHHGQTPVLSAANHGLPIVQQAASVAHNAHPQTSQQLPPAQTPAVQITSEEQVKGLLELLLAMAIEKFREVGVRDTVNLPQLALAASAHQEGGIMPAGTGNTQQPREVQLPTLSVDDDFGLSSQSGIDHFEEEVSVGEERSVPTSTPPIQHDNLPLDDSTKGETPLSLTTFETDAPVSSPSSDSQCPSSTLSVDSNTPPSSSQSEYCSPVTAVQTVHKHEQSTSALKPAKGRRSHAKGPKASTQKKLGFYPIGGNHNPENEVSVDGKANVSIEQGFNSAYQLTRITKNLDEQSPTVRAPGRSDEPESRNVSNIGGVKRRASVELAAPPKRKAIDSGERRPFLKLG